MTTTEDKARKIVDECTMFHQEGGHIINQHSITAAIAAEFRSYEERIAKLRGALEFYTETNMEIGAVAREAIIQDNEAK